MNDWMEAQVLVGITPQHPFFTHGLQKLFIIPESRKSSCFPLTSVTADPAIVFKNKAYLWLFSGILCLVRVANTFALYYGHLFE